MSCTYTYIFTHTSLYIYICYIYIYMHICIYACYIQYDMHMHSYTFRTASTKLLVIEEVQRWLREQQDVPVTIHERKRIWGIFVQHFNEYLRSWKSASILRTDVLTNYPALHQELEQRNMWEFDGQKQRLRDFDELTICTEITSGIFPYWR